MADNGFVSEVLTVRLKGISSLLGSSPSDPDIYKEFIAAKNAKNAEENKAFAADADSIPVDEEKVEMKVTRFFKDKDGDIILKDYQVKGFLKNALNTLKDSVGVVAAASKVDKYVFVSNLEGGRDIKLMRAGKPIPQEDSIYERPLRAMTMQGPRVTLAASEMVSMEDDEDPWYLDVKIEVLFNKGTAKSKAVTAELIREVMEYGKFSGLLQFRNGGFGKFIVEDI